MFSFLYFQTQKRPLQCDKTLFITRRIAKVSFGAKPNITEFGWHRLSLKTRLRTKQFPVAPSDDENYEYCSYSVKGELNTWAIRRASAG